eukprot:gene4336-5063_t
MRVSTIILLAVVFVGSVANGAQDLFVNFQPHQDAGCKGAVEGIGYAFSINQCVDLPTGEGSYYFIVTALRAGWKIYNQTGCKGPFAVNSMKNGTCTSVDFVPQVPATQYATMYISQQPVRQIADTLFFSEYADKQCTNLLAYATASSGLNVTMSTSGEQISLSCSGSSPTGEFCAPGESGPCKTYNLAQACEHTGKVFTKIDCNSIPKK